MMVAGYGTAFGVCCNETYIVGPGAFATLLRSGWWPKMLLMHEGEEIGSWLKIHDDGNGLHMVGVIDLTNERGRLACQMVEDGEATGFSLGGNMAAMQKPIGGGVCHIREVLDVVEVSIVTVPGNPGALIHEYALTG
ncbi:HK97 family phage prohead protease [Mesorhizobium sp. AaZ16]|uniref:HK97 family phage prohead protease n=1 Tax=Mesorhizobium sp. AaZ16 TaxID=3402289 RepID=UPI00374E51CF